MNKIFSLLTVLAFVTFAGYGQSPVFQWGAVVKSNVSGSENPTNAIRSIKTNANGDVFFSGTFTSNNTESKKFTRVIHDHYDQNGTLTATTSPEGAKVTRSATSNNENWILYKTDKQGKILWQVVSDRGYVDLHYSQIVPTSDGGVLAVLNTRIVSGDEFEDSRLLRLIGSDEVKKDVKLETYETNTLQGVAAKIDADGKIEWVKHIIRVDDGLIDGKNATTASYFQALVEDNDGNFWLGGRYIKAITFDKPDGTTQTLTPHNVEGWNGDAQNQRGDALLVKLNPKGELLHSIETSGIVDYQSVGSLQYNNGTLYVYGNLAATPDDETSSTTLLGHTLYPTEKTNAYSARLNVSGDEPVAEWVKLLKSLPQTNGQGGRIKITNINYDNDALFLAGSLTGFVEVDGDTILANDYAGEGTNYLRGFVIRQDTVTGEILGAHVDAAAGLAAEIENVAFRQDKIYAFGYTLGVTWLHVYDTNFSPVAGYNLLGAQGATAWDALFLEDEFITVNRGRQLTAVSGSITGAPQEFINDAPQAYSAYLLSYELEGLSQGQNGIDELASGFDAVKITTLPAAIRIAGNAEVRIFTLAGIQVYAGSINGEKTIALPAGLYIVTANGKATKTVVR